MTGAPNGPAASPPLQRLVARLGLVVTAAILLLFALLMVLHEANNRRASLESEMRVAAAMIGANSAAAISFGNATEANEILRALSAWPDVQQAQLFLPDGQLFGEYRLGGGSNCPGLPVERRRRTEWRLDVCGAVIHAPVVLYGQVVGWVGLYVGLGETYRALALTLGFAGVGALLAFLVSVPLWRRVAGRAAKPLTELVAVTERVGREHDFTVRAQATGLQEVEHLAGAFNAMLTELQRHDDAVRRELVERREANERLGGLAYLDAVTGLHNRHYFNERIDGAFERARRGHGSFALASIDLDGFKGVNDRFGHDRGDELLREVGRRLVKVLRRDDCICRLGGDEFAVIVDGDVSLARTEEIAATLVAELSGPYWIDGFNPNVSASVGVCLYPLHGTERDTLLKQADAAMYRAKQAGKNRYCLPLA